MKNKLILGASIVVILIIAMIVIKMSTGSTQNSMANDGSASSTANATKTAMINGQEVQVSGLVPVTTNSKEQKASIVFMCDNQKSIEGLAYVGGSNPRMEVSLIDYAEGVKGIPNETRKFLLQQVPAEFNAAKYATRDGSIVLTTVDDDETHLYENGKEVFKKCRYTTSSIIE